jgi:tripartite-type tricarboxylate transporter receptor subunit TctC
MFQAFRRLGAVVAIVVLALPCLAHEAAAQDFYRGKKITILVGSSAGGGYDAYARALQRYYGNHIPGKPTIIVENMPGAGSWTAVLHLDSGAPPDGTVMTIFNAGIITETVTDPQSARQKLSDFAWLGSVSRDVRTCYVWSGLGLKSWEDLKRPKETSFGATGVGSASYNDIVMLHNLFGLNARPILGYPGRSEVHLAIERGELDGECGSTASLPEDWLRNHKATMLLRLAAIRTPEVPESVPYARDVLQTEEQKEILDILTVANEVGRPFILSKRVPADRLAILRAAFDETMKDPEYVAFSDKQQLPVIPLGGEEAGKLVAHIYEVKPDVAAKAKAIITPN